MCTTMNGTLCAKSRWWNWLRSCVYSELTDYDVYFIQEESDQKQRIIEANTEEIATLKKEINALKQLFVDS